MELSDPGIKPGSPVLQADSLPAELLIGLCILISSGPVLLLLLIGLSCVYLKYSSLGSSEGVLLILVGAKCMGPFCEACFVLYSFSALDKPV